MENHILCRPWWRHCVLLHVKFKKFRRILGAFLKEKIFSAEDCQLKLGCCWEDDLEVMQKYPWLPRCYKRQRDSQGIEETDPIQIDLNELVARSADFGGN